jgi:hypothetical protein
LIELSAPPSAYTHGTLTLTNDEALQLAAELIALADPDAAAHVRAGPIGIGAEFVALLREIVAR